MSDETKEEGRPAPAKFGGRGAKAAAARKAAAAAGKPVARRGESPTPEPAQEQPEEQAEQETSLPHQAPPPVIIEARPENVTLGSEDDSEMRYVAPPKDADDADEIAHHRRRIRVGNRSMERGFSKLQRDWVLSVGLHIWEATGENRKLKAAGYKSVEAFAVSVGMTKQDVYRVRRAVPVYEVIGDMVETPLNERTIRVLYGTLTNDKKELEPTPERQEHLRQQFAEMKAAGKVSSSGAVWARRLLELDRPSSPLNEDEEDTNSTSPVLRLEQAVKAKRLVDLDLLRKVQAEDPEKVKVYVAELRERYEAAAALVEG